MLLASVLSSTSLACEPPGVGVFECYHGTYGMRWLHFFICNSIINSSNYDLIQYTLDNHQKNSKKENIKTDKKGKREPVPV